MLMLIPDLVAIEVKQLFPELTILLTSCQANWVYCLFVGFVVESKIRHCLVCITLGALRGCSRITCVLKSLFPLCLMSQSHKSMLKDDFKKSPHSHIASKGKIVIKWVKKNTNGTMIAEPRLDKKRKKKGKNGNSINQTN